MDACDGGLAITRALMSGSSRFLKDMLQRYSRQVITAGKADELVADLGGPLPGHSIFTGHLIDALSGKAADSGGILTANGVMAYVYRHVGQDPDSQQTPHFGYLDGDGDLIFRAPILSEIEETDKHSEDVLIAVPTPAYPNGVSEELTIADKTKEFLSDSNKQIQLHDLVVDLTREAMASTDDEVFPVQTPWSAEEFAERLERYERSISDLLSIHVLMGYWASQEFREIYTLPLRRLAGRIQSTSGINIWLSGRWYPLFLLTYGFGIAAVGASRYDNLYQLLHIPVMNPRSGKLESLLTSLIAGVGDMSEAFKSLPGHERQYTPHSEYLFKLIQPTLDDLLFIGADYELYFDHFEILIALEHAHINEKNGRGIWGPIGRFGWKYHRGYGSPFASLISEAETMGETWPPIASGFFDGEFNRFSQISEEMNNRINSLGWF
jgi:hypothetical protein